ncbi:hypothetical protein B0O99DRAFT_548979 [Bisporella sp. PMI_857]|nr:hypothetical protein B0O99DRAFT_548979 [Bisporella sp. PMI_857]
MQIKSLLMTVFFTGLSLALPSELLADRAVCTAPNCTAKCPDGFKYDCCVIYIRDPCTDHQLPKCTGPFDFECKCKCPNSDILYLCNVQYIRDPCSPLPSAAAA